MNPGRMTCYEQLAQIMRGKAEKARFAAGDRSADREVKVCRYSGCTNEHDHNNACCSPGCYKAWRQEKKGE